MYFLIIYLPHGTVVMWTRSEIPDGWVKCDGSPEAVAAGAPNLSGRFVLGAGQGSVEGMTNRTLDEFGPENGIEGDEDTIDTGVRNGGEVHKLTESQMPEHNFFSFGKTVVLVGIRIINNTDRGYLTCYQTSTNTGGSEEHNNMPPYYVLIYIMKIY